MTVLDEFCAQLDSGMGMSVTNILPGLNAVCLCICVVLCCVSALFCFFSQIILNFFFMENKL